jgi:hypothetical protein
MFSGGKPFGKVRPQLDYQHERRIALDAGALVSGPLADAVKFLAGIKARLVLLRRRGYGALFCRDQPQQPLLVRHTLTNYFINPA